MPADTPSNLIDARIASLADWRGAMLAQARAVIRAAAPGVVEEWKWRGTPVWSLDGIVCTGETYKQVVKLTFAHGAALPDPARLFNSSLDGNVRRAIDIRDGEALNAPALTALVQAAVAWNHAAVAARAAKRRPAGSTTVPAAAVKTAQAAATAKRPSTTTAKQPTAAATKKPATVAKRASVKPR